MIEPKLTSLYSLSDSMVFVGESGKVIVIGMQRQLRFKIGTFLKRQSLCSSLGAFLHHELQPLHHLEGSIDEKIEELE
jgi:hypothetical protein